MWGKTINSATYLSRSANHSTKGSRRGYCDIGIVVDEKELTDNPEAVRARIVGLMNECREERLQIESEIANLRSNIRNWRKNVSYKYKGREHLFSDDKKKVSKLIRYFYLGDLIEDAKSKLASIPLVKIDRNKAFVDAAKKILDKDTFDFIMKEAYK